MKKIFLSILITFLAGIAVLLGFSFIKRTDYVAKSHSSTEVNKTWKVALANYVNENGISLSVDGEVLEDVKSEAAFMADDMELMVEKKAVTDLFGCAVNLYDDSVLTIARGETEVQVSVNEASVMNVNGEDVEITHSPFKADGTVYIPAEVIENGVGYSYEWDSKSRTVIMNNNVPNAPSLPPYYNYADVGRISIARDQGSLGTCWAFASLSALESSLLPEENYDFSEDHMLHNNGFGLNLEDGGDYIMALAYLSSWKGPILEEDDPYGDGETNSSHPPVKHVQEVRILENKDYQKIKEMVFKYGAVETSIYMALVDSNTISQEYYSPEFHSYCYPNSAVPNHEIIIIGWDDNYPAENFRTPVSKDGAFICRNSWGSNFGEDGIFYVSYEDNVIGSSGEVYTRIESIDNYDHIYQYDECGWIGRIGYNKNHGYFANVYTTEGEESLEAVSFYATDPDTSYKVYVVTELGSSDSSIISLPAESSAAGKFKEEGYYTVKLDKAVPLAAGKDYAVVVEIDTPGSSHPIAMEMVNEDDIRTNPVVLDGKRSYISNYGDIWEKTQETSKCNVCLKAFTKDR
ncbi:MAG: cell surface protein [Parasporobacterium sp.]|nr:cell surface protein [Parasporobacterium sp.]